MTARRFSVARDRVTRPVRILDQWVLPHSVIALIILLTSSVPAVCNGAVDAEVMIGSIDPNPANGGDTIIIPLSIENTGDAIHTFAIGAQIWRSVHMATLPNKTVTVQPGPGNFYTTSYSYTIPLDWPADLYEVQITAWEDSVGGTLLDEDAAPFAIESDETTPPTVDVDVQGIGTTSATGTISFVDDGGEDCACQLEYGWGGSVRAFTGWFGTWNQGTQGFWPLSGLPLATECFFRARGRNSAGEGPWDEVTFATLSGPPTINVTVHDVAATRATVTVRLISDGGEECVVALSIEGQGHWSWEHLRTGDSRAISLSGLARDTTYSFAALASNSAGSCDDNGTFTTAMYDPPTVSGSATNVTSTGATIVATLSDDGGAPCTVACVVMTRFEQVVSQTSWENLRTGQSRSMNVSGLEPETQYMFMVSAQNSASYAQEWGDLTTTANGGRDCTLLLSSTTGGRVVEPGEGLYYYPCETSVTLEAEADPGYRFTHWSGSVDIEEEERITIDLNGDYHIKANFVGSYSASGRVTDKEGAGIAHVRIDFGHWGECEYRPTPVFTDWSGHWTQDGFQFGTRYEAIPGTSQPGQSYSFVPGLRRFDLADQAISLDFVAEGASTSGVRLLTVPYLYQEKRSWCFWTSLAMCVQQFGTPIQPEHVAQYFNAGLQEGYGPGFEALQDWLDWSGLTDDDIGIFLARYNLGCDWLAILTFDRVKRAIADGTPIIVGADGHAVVVVGYDENTAGDKAVFVHDPGTPDSGIYKRSDAEIFFHEKNFGNYLLIYALDGGEGLPDPYPCLQFVHPLMEEEGLPEPARYWVNNIDTSSGGADISKGLASRIGVFCMLTDQGKDRQAPALRPPSNYIVRLKIYNQEGMVASQDKSVPNVEPGTARPVETFLEPQDYTTWSDGSYSLYLDLLTEDLLTVYETIGPFTFGLCSYRVSDLNMSDGSRVFLSELTLRGAGKQQADILNWVRTCSISGTHSANVRIYDGSWDWSFGFDACAIEAASEEKFDNTGINALEFKVEVTSQDGRVWLSFDECGWTSTDTDGDGFFGDYSGRGGCVPRIESPITYAGPPPAELLFSVKVRAKPDGMSVWREGPAVRVGSVTTTAD